MSLATVTVLEDYRERVSRLRVVLADPSLDHQIRLITSRGGGSGITIKCNCGARFSRNLAVGENPVPHYKEHLAGAW
jgi:hypothetical protein